MKLIVDTNVLVRAAGIEDEPQRDIARALLTTASSVTISLVALCEYVWVMRSRYRRPHAEIAASIEALLATDKMVVDRQAVAVGLRFLAGGGDFADGVIAYDGQRLGGRIFASFDREANRLALAAGIEVAAETQA